MQFLYNNYKNIINYTKFNLFKLQKVNKIVSRSMKSTIEPIIKEGKKVADKAIATQASNIQSTSTTQNSSSGGLSPNVNSSSNNQVNALSTPKSPFDTYAGPLKAVEPIADSVQHLSPDAQRFQTYVDNKLIEYSPTGETKLTPLGYQLFMATQPKAEINEYKNTEANQAKSSLKNDAVLFENTGERAPLIAGMLKPSNDAEILTPIQTHLVVGVEQDDNSVRVFSGLTSEKGTKSGIQGVKTTYKIADTQPISGHQNKGQYARPISPPIDVPYDQFEPHQQATDFVNESEVNEKLYQIKEKTEKFKPIPYKKDGITSDDLEMALELKQNMSELSTVTSTEEQDQTNNEN